MKNTTRKHIWPMSLVMGLAVIGALAVIVALSALPGSAQAQTEPTNPFAPAPPAAEDAFDNSSTTGGASVKLTLTLGEPGALQAGSSVELYLEDDFQVGDIDHSRVYFIGASTGRVYVTDAVVVDDDDHFGGDDDWSIQVFVPDMNPGNDTGFDAWSAADTVGLQLVLDKAGVNNPTEQGTHSVGYSILPAGADNNDGPQVTLDAVNTWAKISLSDEDNGRGAEITVTGTGFNNGTGAEVRVLVSDTDLTAGDPATQRANCQLIMQTGEKLGETLVGSDDKFSVSFTVHQDEFDAGAVNYICAADSEAGDPRFARAVKVFDLEGSLTVSPASASYGDEITLKPRDVGTIEQISVGPRHIWRADGTCPDLAICNFEVERDDSDYTFDLPGGLDARVQIAVKGAAGTERVYLGVEASSLQISSSEVVANDTIIIEGRGFDSESHINVADITIDGEPLDVAEAGVEGGAIQIDSNGQFVVEARVWTVTNRGATSGNPALDADTYTIEVVDSTGFEGEADITILEPTISVTPAVAGPRDYITISGENWPFSTDDQDFSVDISVEGKDRSASIDRTGRFSFQYRLSSGIALGDEHDVTVTFAEYGGDIEEDASFSTPTSGISVSPSAVRPGETISIELLGMPVFTLVSEVRIAGANRLGNQNVNTDRDGNATVAGLLVPAVDAGHYSVQVTVGNETAVAQLEILDEAAAVGTATTLPDAVSDLGDNLDAIFHFNNSTKEWTFFDPRPEFSELNTLTELISGQPYWVLVKADQTGVNWSGQLVDFTCAAEDCWSLNIW